MSLKRSDVATVADWSFTEDAEVMEAVDRLVVASSFRCPLNEADDLRQEVYLWLSVRPGLFEKDFGLVEQSIYRRLRQLEDNARNADSRTLPLEEWDA